MMKGRLRGKMEKGWGHQEVVYKEDEGLRVRRLCEHVKKKQDVTRTTAWQ